MPKQTTSQWDFSGELFPPEATRRVLSVSELTADIRRLLEKQIGQIWVTGEITNCRAQSSGHVYFTLKDAAAQLNCIVFRTDALANRAALQDGRKVILKGEMTVYEPRGQYQLRVLAVELQGVGALQAAFEKLKEKLAAEGLFALDRKRPLPRFPQRIGLITSPTGAAIRDVLHVAQRRNPSLEIIFVPCAVQGPGAAGEIAAAIALLNQWSHVPGRKLDVILLTRGGGSLEDLWAFNEEMVARAIFNSALPVVSAIGHEIDFTISDFVADLRAATPSAAAEILTEAAFSSCKWMAQAQARKCANWSAGGCWANAAISSNFCSGSNPASPAGCSISACKGWTTCKPPSLAVRVNNCKNTAPPAKISAPDWTGFVPGNCWRNGAKP